MATAKTTANTTTATSITDRLRSDIGGDIRSELYPRRGPALFLSAFALFWIASAVFHLGVFLLDDTVWAGPVSWRKPIVFSASIGLLLWTYGWVLDRLPDRRRLAWGLAVAMAVSSTLENALIIFQTWRGRASHFNVAESGDALIFNLMGALVGVMSILLVALFVWTLRRRPKSGLDKVAAIAGLAIIMTGLGIGQWIVNLGTAYVQQFGTVPEQVINGEAGVVKFPHAIAFHGIQVFIIAAMLLGRSAVSKQRAMQLMGLVVASYVGILVFATVQTIGGRAPFDLDIIAGGLLTVSVLGLIGSMAACLRIWLTRPAPAKTAIDVTAASAGSPRAPQATLLP